MGFRKLEMSSDRLIASAVFGKTGVNSFTSVRFTTICRGSELMGGAPRSYATTEKTNCSVPASRSKS